MYKVNYHVNIKKIINGLERFERYLSVLEAEFNFGREILQKDRHLIREILSIKNGSFNDKNSLIGYLFTNGFIYNEREEHFCHGYNKDDDRIIMIKEHIIRLGFDFKVVSRKVISLEKMFDLDGLNNFVLTGKIT